MYAIILYIYAGMENEMRHKIVLMTGGTETLEFFSLQLKKGFEALGYKTFLFDQTTEEESAEKLYDFATAYDTILVTFNFDGIHYETSLFNMNGVSIWDERKIPCVNMAVDHPYFYPELFDIHPDIFYEVSIDRYHDRYMKRFYPELMSGTFLPLGGTSLSPNGDYKKMADRKYDICFTGNYTPPEVFDDAINRLGDEYAMFYLEIIHDLITNPDKPDDLTMEEHLKKAIPGITHEEVKTAIPNMIFIDTYVRCYFRGEVIKTLADAGFKIHCVGKGYDNLRCKHPENLDMNPDELSYGCLEALANSRLSLNVMPWFKDGAHDRIFNSMCNGAVCITDHSKYLDEILTPDENIIFYDLKQLDKLPEIFENALNDTDKLERIQKNAFNFANREHTWYVRAKQLHNELLKFL